MTIILALLLAAAGAVGDAKLALAIKTGDPDAAATAR
jgi:hypothetical protein